MLVWRNERMVFAGFGGYPIRHAQAVIAASPVSVTIVALTRKKLMAMAAAFTAALQILGFGEEAITDTHLNLADT